MAVKEQFGMELRRICPGGTLVVATGMALGASICFLTLGAFDFAIQPAVAAPIEGDQPMSDLTTDDQKPLQLSDRPDIKHEGREAFIKGYQAQKSGYWSIAIGYYQKAIDTNPDMYEAFWNQGVCDEMDNKFDKAKIAFETALKIDWQNPLVYKHLAYLSFKLGNNDEGREYLKKYLHR